MLDIRYWIEKVQHLCEDYDDAEGRDDPRIQQLDKLLSLWGEGWANKAWSDDKLQHDLLALREVASWWRDVNGWHDFYRGIILSEQQITQLTQTGQFVIETPHTRPLSSWTPERHDALKWIEGFEGSPWVVIEKPLEEMEVFVNFSEFVHEFDGYWPEISEVIMLMPPRMVITRDEIIESANLP